MPATDDTSPATEKDFKDLDQQGDGLSCWEVRLRDMEIRLVQHFTARAKKLVDDFKEWDRVGRLKRKARQLAIPMP